MQLKRNKDLPRGYRNNNPLNIRRTADIWDGECKKVTDREFCEFIYMKYGYRAFFKLIRSYNIRYGIKTVGAIIKRFAPPLENNTGWYVELVCKYTGYTPDTVIKYTNQSDMCRLAYSMACVENGVAPSSMVPILEGWDLFSKTLTNFELERRC